VATGTKQAIVTNLQVNPSHGSGKTVDQRQQGVRDQTQPLANNKG